MVKSVKAEIKSFSWAEQKTHHERGFQQRNSTQFERKECHSNARNFPHRIGFSVQVGQFFGGNSPLLSSPTPTCCGNMFFSPNSLEYNLSIATANASPSGWSWESRALKVVCISEGAIEWAEARDGENVSMVTRLNHSGVSYKVLLQTTSWFNTADEGTAEHLYY